MQVNVLGELEVLLASGEPAELGGAKPRTLLAVLVAAEGRPVHVGRLVEQVWGEEPPERVEASLQSYVARLRKAFGGTEGEAGRLRTHTGGYSLDVAADEVDARRFAASIRRARSLVETDPHAAESLLAATLAQWRGEPFSGLACPALESEARRLDELRLVATETLWDARLRTGGHPEATAELETLVSLHPLRERLWGFLARAQYAADRQGEALDTLRRAREHLAEELGIDPGPQLRDLETALLRQDPRLLATAEDPRLLATTETAPTSPGPPPPETADGTPADEDGASDEDARVADARGEADRIVGRADELAAVERLIDSALSGRGRVLLLTGEPGIGKTRLLEAVAARAHARGLRVGRAGWEAEPGPVLLPWRTAVRGIVDREDVLDSPEETRDAASESHRLADAVAEALRSGPPALIALDDLHWADDDSLRLARRLASLTASLPVLLVLASRPPTPDAPPALTDLFAALARSGAERRRLRGLGPEGIADYVRDRVGVSVPPAVAQALESRTEGNPFFVTEVVRLLMAEGALADAESAAWRRVPDVVGDVVRQRLDVLPAASRRVLEAAAVLGRSFATHVLAREELAPDPGHERQDVRDLVDETMEAGLVLGLLEAADPGEFRFTHAVVRDAVYETVPAPARARLHATAASVLERLYAGQWDARSAELAEHYRLAGPTHARAGWGFALRAARQATERSAHAEALRWLEIAQSLQQHDPMLIPEEREDALAAQAKALALLGRAAEVWSIRATAGRSALDRGDPARAARILLAANDGAIWGWRRLGDLDPAAIGLWREIRDALGESEPILRAQVELALEVEQMHRLDPTQGASTAAPDPIEDALGVVRAAHRTDRELLDTLSLASLALKRPAQLVRRAAVVDELVALSARNGDEALLTRALATRISVRGELGQWDEARSDLERASELAARHHMVQDLFICQTARAWFLVVEGHLDRAGELVAATEAARDTLATPGVGIDVGQRAFLARAQGRPGDAAALMEPLVPLVPGIFRDLYYLLLAEAGETEVVRRRIGAWREQPRLAHDYMWTSVTTFRGRLWLRLGDPEAIRDLRRELEPYASRLANFGVTAFFEGVIGHTVGELALAEGDVESGRAHLDAARVTYRRLGLEDWVERVDALTS